jgi:5-(carboxyamino)imidazole ribonucleotide synthase
VEFFVDKNDLLLVNEFAPRPHNSGHATIDASRISQFEQQVRTLAGQPLGDTTMHSPVVMQNLLGDLWGNGTPRWQVLLADSGTTLHLYGKAEARRGRKMGHYTCVAPTFGQAAETDDGIRVKLAQKRTPASEISKMAETESASKPDFRLGFAVKDLAVGAMVSLV